MHYIIKFLFFFVFVFSLCAVDNISERTVTVRITNSENSVTAKKQAIKNAYIKVANLLLEEKGLSFGVVSQISENILLDEEGILKLFSEFIESFSIYDEKISDDDYQAAFNFKINDTKFNAWAFTIVKQMMKRSDFKNKTDDVKENIYAKEEKSESAPEVIDATFKPKETTLLCNFKTSFSEWMYFYKEYIDRTFSGYSVLSICDQQIKIVLENHDDMMMERLVPEFAEAGLRLSKIRPQEWYLEQKL